MNAEERFQDLIREGLAASGDGRRDVALDLYAQAAALLPASGIPHFLVGSEHASAGDIAAAETAFARAVLLSPDFPLARYQLGLLQFSAQRPALALVTWGPLLSLSPTESLGHFVRGFAVLAEDRFAECARHFEAGLACADANPAVAGDIRRVLEALRGLASTAEGPSREPGGHHVLLAAYGRGLH
jgi:tetratricopeptide (TPR) repeat protein